MPVLQQSVPTFVNRRSFLSSSTFSLGAAALASLAKPAWLHPATTSAGLNSLPDFAPKAKRVIFLCMAGGPSHLETFDYKPNLGKLNGQPMPESFTKGQPIAQLQNQQLKCLGPIFKFRRHGQSGQEISDVLPGIGGIADDIAIVRSMHTDQINHDPAHTVMNTGTSISGRPSMGAWVTYGLGSMNDDLPGFVVLTSQGGRNPQPISSRQWGAGFLPSKFQGVQFYSQGDPVHYVRSSPGINREQQSSFVDTVGKLNRIRNHKVNNPEIESRIAQYELAFRMQASVPELMNFDGEPQHVLDRYGVKEMDGSFASNCLLARRLAERGTRFIHLYHRGWDHHGGVKNAITGVAKRVDQGSAALIQDLKQRGMFDDTLVVWGGEFGRTNYCQGSLGKDNFGRDHHGRCFSFWMAGGGSKGGTAVGRTDDYGYNVVEDGVHVHDFHATMLHLLGIDHERLTFKYQGRYFRLTDVHGKLIKKALA